jgi:hypothetical protein
MYDAQDDESLWCSLEIIDNSTGSTIREDYISRDSLDEEYVYSGWCIWDPVHDQYYDNEEIYFPTLLDAVDEYKNRIEEWDRYELQLTTQTQSRYIETLTTVSGLDALDEYKSYNKYREESRC